MPTRNWTIRMDQEERFKEQMRLADKGDDEAMIIDQDFLRALQYGMLLHRVSVSVSTVWWC